MTPRTSREARSGDLIFATLGGILRLPREARLGDLIFATLGGIVRLPRETRGTEPAVHNRTWHRIITCGSQPTVAQTPAVHNRAWHSICGSHPRVVQDQNPHARTTLGSTPVPHLRAGGICKAIWIWLFRLCFCVWLCVFIWTCLSVLMCSIVICWNAIGINYIVCWLCLNYITNKSTDSALYDLYLTHV